MELQGIKKHGQLSTVESWVSDLEDSKSHIIPLFVLQSLKGEVIEQRSQH